MNEQDASDPGGTSPPASDASRRSSEHRYVLIAAAVVGLGMLVAGTFLSADPRGVGTHEQLGLPPCMTLELWGVPCPGCGVTTSVTLASHGRFADSFRTQPLGLALWFLGAAFVLWSAIGHLVGVDLGRALRRMRTGPLVSVLVVIAGAAWIYKIFAAG